MLYNITRKTQNVMVNITAMKVLKIIPNCFLEWKEVLLWDLFIAKDPLIIKNEKNKKGNMISPKEK